MQKTEKKKPLTITMKPSIKKRADAQAKKLGLSLSQYIAGLIEKDLRAQAKKSGLPLSQYIAELIKEDPDNV
jgi:antitoxin component of RelBE/YafQ-DinJ toxin-antitoxin module